LPAQSLLTAREIQEKVPQGLYASGAVKLMLDIAGTGGLDFTYLPRWMEGCTRWLL